MHCSFAGINAQAGCVGLCAKLTDIEVINFDLNNDIDDKYQTSGIDIEVLPISTISKHPGSTISKLFVA